MGQICVGGCGVGIGGVVGLGVDGVVGVGGVDAVGTVDGGVGAGGVDGGVIRHDIGDGQSNIVVNPVYDAGSTATAI